MATAGRTLHRPSSTIRQLRPSDLTRFEAHLLRLDAESRRDRFNGAINDDFLRHYAGRCFRNGTTVVGYVEEADVLGAAELHERPELVDTGEIAFSVERRRQHQGIGRRLFERLLLHAYGLGYSKLLVTTHADNVAMKRLAQRFDADISFVQGETTGLIQLRPAGLSRAVATAMAPPPAS